MIKGLLQREAKDRLDAHQLINHPFVVNAPKDCHFMETAVDFIGKQQIQDAEKLKARLAAVEQRTKISLNEYLGKQPLTSPLQTLTKKDYKYYGEVNGSGKPHGRGIEINNDGDIWIGYWQNGSDDTGNYIRIYDDGDFDVGECYMRDGVRWVRGTTYYTVGGKFKYDKIW